MVDNHNIYFNVGTSETFFRTLGYVEMNCFICRKSFRQVTGWNDNIFLKYVFQTKLAVAQCRRPLSELHHMWPIRHLSCWIKYGRLTGIRHPSSGATDRVGIPAPPKIKVVFTSITHHTPWPLGQNGTVVSYYQIEHAHHLSYWLFFLHNSVDLSNSPPKPLDADMDAGNSDRWDTWLCQPTRTSGKYVW